MLGLSWPSHSCAVRNPACCTVLHIQVHHPSSANPLGKSSWRARSLFSEVKIPGPVKLTVNIKHYRQEVWRQTDRHQNQMEAELPGRAGFPPQCTAYVEGGTGPEPHPAGSTVLHTTESLSSSWEIKTLQPPKRGGIIREEQKHGKGVQSEGHGGACF